MVEDTKTNSDVPDRRFGQIALEMDFISVEQLLDALAFQQTDDLAGKPHRYLGAILVDRGHMTAIQIEMVLDVILNQARQSGP